MDGSSRCDSNHQIAVNILAIQEIITTIFEVCVVLLIAIYLIRSIMSD
jgi:hypothetical protein